MRWLLLLLFVGLGVSGVVLAARENPSLLGGIARDDFGGLITKIAFLVFLSGTVLVLVRGNFRKALAAVVLWLAVGLALAAAYAYRYEMQDVSNRILSELIPGRAYSRGRTVEIARGRSGDFRISVEINGVKIPMALDTGASAVVLTAEAAKAVGLPLEVLSYNISVDTANGRARAASVTLDKLAVGGIVERAVPALIAQPGQLRTNLLGMSFLDRLESWQVRGDRLILRGYP